MQKKKKSIEVLGKCKMLIEILRLFKVNRLNIVSNDNLYTVLVTIPAVMLILLMILLIWFCSDYKFNVNDVSITMSVFIGSGQILLTSFPLIKETDLMIETVNRLQVLVEKRKFY